MKMHLVGVNAMHGRFGDREAFENLERAIARARQSAALIEKLADLAPVRSG